MAPKRKFQILDALVLVAATAVGLAWSVAWARGWWEPSESLALNEHEFCRFFTFFQVSWTLAFPLLRIRSPRPSGRRLGRYPGTAASLTVLIVLALNLVEALTSWGLRLMWVHVKEAEKLTEVLLDVTQNRMAEQAGPSLFATSLIFALIRRTRVQWDWIEVLGFILGIGWILLFFENVIADVLWGLPA